MGKIIEKCEHCGAKLEYDNNDREVVCEYCNCKKIINSSSNSILFNNDYSNEYNSVYNNENNTITNNIINSNILSEIDQKKTIPSNKKKKKKRNGKKKLLYLFFLIIIVASGVIYYLDYQERNKPNEMFESLPSEIIVTDEDKKSVKVDETTIKLAPDVDLNAERSKNKNNDIVGRLEIPNLINTLVAKSSDNVYYLNHSVKKEYDIRGTEFLDYRLTTTSKQINIYGHNTRDSRIKVAFLKLEQFLNKDFFDKNQYVIFQHDGGKNIYKIIAIKEVRASNREHMIVEYTGSQFVEHVRNMTTGEGVINSREVPYNESSEIIVLQTCSHHWDNAYYTLIAIRI